MSHYASFTTEIGNADYLTKALEAMNLPVEVAKAGETLTARNSYNTGNDQVQILVRREGIASGTRTDIGFKLNDKGTYDLVVDGYDINRHFEGDFRSKLMQQYARQTVIGAAEENGLTILEEETVNGEVVLRIGANNSFSSMGSFAV